MHAMRDDQKEVMLSTPDASLPIFAAQTYGVDRDWVSTVTAHQRACVFLASYIRKYHHSSAPILDGLGIV